MALDLFLRAETPATYIDWLTKPQVRAIIGELRARDENGDVASPAALRGIPGAVDLVQWQENKIIAGVFDPQAWIQVRLTGSAEADDFTGPPIDVEVEFDRWEHSRMVNLLSSGGTASTYRGVTTFENVAGNAKGISIFRSFEMETTIKFHEFMGGSQF